VTEMAGPNRISRVILRNYKSIRQCDVSLVSITFLVGPNGAGKSNFVEALRFLSYGLSSSLEQALDNRSGFSSILHRGAAPRSGILFDVSFQLGDRTGRYLVEIAASGDGPVTVTREECTVEFRSGKHWFRVNDGVVTSNQGLTPAASDEKFYLVNASGLTPFEPVYRALSSIAVLCRMKSVASNLRSGIGTLIERVAL
jgi:predicted ATPase